MSNPDFQSALTYAGAAMELLRRSGVPPYPQFYELFYTYATGANPTLNRRLNAVLKNEGTQADLPDRLYEEFVRANDHSERISNVSERMSARIEAVHDAIDAAMANATSFSGSLQLAAGSLGPDIGQEVIRQLAERLLAETRRMQDTNQQLEQKLEASRDDIAQLQQDLDVVRRESLLDPLTKLFNRSALDEALLRAIERAGQQLEPLSLMLLDIDHFKRFNDLYGHQTGDQVLRLVAMTLKSNIKGKDIAARYGGEEFLAILPSTDLDAAIAIADDIRRAIQAKELLKRSTNEKLGRITASIGVAMLHPGDGPASLIERADRCLYAAKHAGRNRVFGEKELLTDRQVLGDEAA